jgi:hypothetical protein
VARRVLTDQAGVRFLGPDLIEMTLVLCLLHPRSATKFERHVTNDPIVLREVKIAVRSVLRTNTARSTSPGQHPDAR